MNNAAKNSNPRYDYVGLIERMGGHQKLGFKFDHYGYGEITARRIYQWQRRNQVPPYYVAVLFGIALKEGIIEDVLAELERDRIF